MNHDAAHKFIYSLPEVTADLLRLVVPDLVDELDPRHLGGPLIGVSGRRPPQAPERHGLAGLLPQGPGGRRRPALPPSSGGVSMLQAVF